MKLHTSTTLKTPLLKPRQVLRDIKQLPGQRARGGRVQVNPTHSELEDADNAHEAWAKEETLVENGIVELVQLTSSGADSSKEEHELRVLARQPDSRAAIAAADVAPVVELTRSGSIGAMEHAAAALANLAVLNDANKMAIVAAGGIAPLVELTRSGTAGAKTYAATALASLAVNDEHRVAIVAAGGVAPLIELMCSDKIGLAVAAAGAIAPLVALTRTGTPGAKEQAEAALQNVAFDPANAEAIAAKWGAHSVV